MVGGRPVYQVIVMGVAGCGKSVVGARLAQALGCEMIEGDDFHPEVNKLKMRSGVALDDRDREPWLAQLGALMASRPGGSVLSCSALKRRYRDQLRSFVPQLKFVYVEIDVATAAQRVGARSEHLFPKSLVSSQFATLESPVGEPGVFAISALLPPAAQVEAVVRWLKTAETRSEMTRSIA
jgi:gluconokinase